MDDLDDETKSIIYIGAAAFYDDSAGPKTFRHLDLLYRAACEGKPQPDYIRLKFENESGMNNFFDWLASVFDARVEVDLFKCTEEVNREVYHP